MLLIKLIYWLVIDFKRVMKTGRVLHIYGIKCFVGMYGGGKTMGMTYYLEEMKKKYGNKIYIATNYYYQNEDFHINTWKDLLPIYDKPIIFAYDELQNEFNSREYKAFPVQLMTLLTQNRKGNGKQILYTAQDYETVDKNFRRLTKEVGVCHTLFNRLTSIKFYEREDYDNLISTPDVRRRMKIHVIKRLKFIQTDDLREKYDSFQMLESAINKEYMSREELQKINQ